MITNGRLKHNKHNREWRACVTVGNEGVEVDAEVYQVDQEKALGERGMMGSKFFLFFFLPQVGSPDGSSYVRSETSYSSSGSEDPPLHPQHLLTLQYPGVHAQTQWWSQQMTVSKGFETDWGTINHIANNQTSSVANKMLKVKVWLVFSLLPILLLLLW